MRFRHFFGHQVHKKLRIKTLIQFLEAEEKNPYASLYASTALPSHMSAPEISADLMQCSTLVLIGIGGSNLGTLAISDALGLLRKTDKDLVFLDTIDTNDVISKLGILEKKLKNGEHIILNVISKSGSTTETIAIFEILYGHLKTRYPEQVHIISISDPGSSLDMLSEKQGWIRYNLPKNVGGRYSVFSNVGLFPLAFLGADIDTLLLGAQRAIGDFKRKKELHPASIVAHTIYNEYASGRNVFEHFLFGKSLENLGKWYRQLLGESIGKIQDDGTAIGITPTTSIGTIDLHSVGQLYLVHPEFRTMAIVGLTGVPDFSVPVCPFPSLVTDIREKNLNFIMDAAQSGLEGALKSRDIPHFSYSMQYEDSEDLGYFLQTKMLEVILLGLLFEVNPFDQPNVEEYKTGMRAFLTKS